MAIDLALILVPSIDDWVLCKKSVFVLCQHIKKIVLDKQITIATITLRLSEFIASMRKTIWKKINFS